MFRILKRKVNGAHTLGHWWQCAIPLSFANLPAEHHSHTFVPSSVTGVVVVVVVVVSDSPFSSVFLGMLLLVNLFSFLSFLVAFSFP